MISAQMKRFRLALGLLAAGSALAPAAAGAQGQPYGVYREDPGSALNRHLRTLADQPRNLSALMGAGKAALQLGDAQAALTFFARAEEIAPTDGRVKAGMGSAFVQMEQAQAALKFFQDAASLGVPEAEFSGDRGLAHDLTGNSRQAQLDYAAALRREDSDEVRRRLALSLAITGQRDQALAAIDAQLRRQDRIAWRTRAFILALTGDAAEATRTAQSVMPTLAGQMQPFFARLPALTPAQRAMAVHFGHFPEHGLELPVPTQQYASAAPAQAAAGTQARQSAAPRRSAAPQGTSTEPRRRPGGDEQRATRQPAQQTASRGATQPTAQRQAERPSGMLAERWGMTGRGPAGRPRQAEQRSPTALGQAQTQRPAAAVPVQPRQSQPSATETRAPVQTPVQAPSVAVAQAPVQGPPASPPSAPPVERETQTPAASQPLSNIVASAIEAQAPPPAEQAPAATAEAPPAAAPVASPIADAELPASTPALAVTQTAPAPAPAPASPEPAPAAAVPGPAMAFENIAAAIAALPAEPAPVPAQTRPLELAQVRERPRASTPPPAPKPAAPKPADKKEEPSKKAAAKDEPAKKAAAKDEPAKKAAAKDEPAKKSAPKEDPAKKEPSRHWVQIAGGANKAGLPREYEKLQEKAPKLLGGRAPWTTPLRFTNRLLVGPFKSEKEAQAFVNELNKLDFTAFTWTSPAGQEIEKLPLK
jgi:tetratricopeptide (TPR) repeat protein